MIQQFTSGCIHIQTENRVSKRDLCTHVQSRTVHDSPVVKQPKCPSMDEWLNSMRPIPIMAYCSALKRKEILTHATTCMNLDDTTRGDISQTKNRYVWFHSHRAPRIVKFLEPKKKKKKMVVSRGWGQGEWGGKCFMGTVLAWGDENILEMNGGDGCTTMWMHLMPLTWTLQNRVKTVNFGYVLPQE